MLIDQRNINKKTNKRIKFGLVSVEVFHSNIWKGVEIFTGTELLLEKTIGPETKSLKKEMKGLVS